MIHLAAYLVVLVIAALLTCRTFGGSSKSDNTLSVPSRGLDFFAAASSSSLCSRGNCITAQLPSNVQTADAEQTRMLAHLQQTCCALPVRAETVHVLAGPAKFYAELQRRVREAQRRIVMSALYVGDGPLSAQFVACLEEKLRDAVQRGQSLDVCLLLDHNRMHHSRNLLTVQRLLLLQPPATTAVRVRVCLFQSPSRWGRLLAPLGRAREVLGVQHTKIFCFDDRDTILTGANLSDDYFATRMDRYVVIEENPHVAAWFTDLVQTLCHISHPVVCREEFASRKGDSTSSSGSSSKDKINGSINNPRLHKKSDLVILPNASGVDPSSECSAFCVLAHQLLKDFAARAAEASAKLQPFGKQYDTFIFPTLQYGRAGVFHDSLVLQQLLHMVPASTHIYLTSPYLNMYEQFVDEVLQSKNSYDFITASVDTNGWRGAKGFAGYIPYFYLQLERAFYYLMREYGCSDRVRVREFSADGLTFHAKGLWFTNQKKSVNVIGGKPCNGPSSSTGSGNASNSGSGNNSRCIRKNGGEEKEHVHVGAPYLVAYGSTNYGYRSVHKDVEAEVFLFTANTTLREALRDELVFLLEQSKLVTEERFVCGARGRFQPVVSLLAQMGQDFL
ncbi:Phospholipase D-like domain [Trypanosoma melophagium]|uniref:Phospholipase D-like domain n=1 Tax=Trypanosoma melophagium TaxID=715481 RepID=UPI00351A2D81|nr:Phospholipase D-like domain [Trypanosoma melophagium]